MKHKSGFVNIIGNPNAGKSTLMNQLVGERLSIITHKAQTTRHRILGIVNDDDYQVVLSDTPGIIDPGYKLHEAMMMAIENAMRDADLFLLITDVKDKQLKDERIIDKIQKSEVPVLVLINKVDLATQEDVEFAVNHWHEMLPRAEILPISALHGLNMDVLWKKIVQLLPEGPAFYAKDALTDRNTRFFIAEIIREQIFMLYTKEIPYSTQVVVEEYKETPKIVHIRAEIIVERDTQKGIIIGHQGKALKKVGVNSRQAIEKFIEQKVFLDLYVKVDKNWRNNDKKLKNYGY